MKACDYGCGDVCKSPRHTASPEYILSPGSVYAVPWYGIPLLCFLAFMISWLLTRGAA